jgi:hypothetical protein
VNTGGVIYFHWKVLFAGNVFVVRTVKRVFWMTPTVFFSLQDGAGHICTGRGRFIPTREMARLYFGKKSPCV